MNDWPSVTTVLRPLFETTYGPLEPGGNKYTKRGHHVGELMDALVSGLELNPAYLEWFNSHEDWRPYIEAGRKYLAENPPRHMPICQLRLEDKIQRVTGKPDWIWAEVGKITDIKTGASEPPEWLGMQTGEYAVLAHEKFGFPFEQREILWLRPDGDYRVIVHDNPHDALDFNTLLQAHWTMRARLNGNH